MNLTAEPVAQDEEPARFNKLFGDRELRVGGAEGTDQELNAYADHGAAEEGKMKKDNPVNRLPVSLDRDIFLQSLIRELAGVLEDVVGYAEASGYISLVGQNIGEWINDSYRKEMGVSLLSREQVAAVLVDLKARIQGNFSVVSQDDDKIILKNDTCPFGDKVLDRPSMCMMTSNVFGFITAENLGYAKVVLEQAIANRDATCTVIVYLKPSAEAAVAEGREYFGTKVR